MEKGNVDFRETNKAANIIILRKVADCMNKSDVLYKKKGIEGVWSTSENVICKIAGMEKGAGGNWKYSEDAKKLYMNKKVYTGEHLIKINGDAFVDLKKEYQRVLKTRIIRKSGKIEDLQYDDIKILSKKKPSEELLWYYILKNKDDSVWKEAKKLIMNDISKQVKEESFQDAQLWLFWNYLRKK